MRLDFRRLGMSLERMGVDYTFGEAIDYWSRLAQEWGTHIHAAANDMDYPMTIAEVELRTLSTNYLNANRDRDIHPEPFKPRWPWRDADYVAPEVRAEFLAKLEARSVFNRVTD